MEASLSATAALLPLHLDGKHVSSEESNACVRSNCFGALSCAGTHIHSRECNPCAADTIPEWPFTRAWEPCEVLVYGSVERFGISVGWRGCFSFRCFSPYSRWKLPKCVNPKRAVRGAVFGTMRLEKKEGMVKARAQREGEDSTETRLRFDLPCQASFPLLLRGCSEEPRCAHAPPSSVHWNTQGGR